MLLYEWSNSKNPSERKKYLINQLEYHKKYVRYLTNRLEELDDAIEEEKKKVKHKKTKGKRKSKGNS